MKTKAVKILLYCCTDTRPNQGTKLRQPEAIVIELPSVDAILDKEMIFSDRMIVAGSKGVIEPPANARPVIFWKFFIFVSARVPSKESLTA